MRNSDFYGATQHTRGHHNHGPHSHDHNQHDRNQHDHSDRGERRARTGGGRGRGHGGHGHGPGGFGQFEGRMRRGAMRGLLLAGLLDGPAHGYELMSRLEERTGGSWRPSPGSVYPMLQQLEDEGLVKLSEQDGRKTYELTEQGRSEADPEVLGDFAENTAAGADKRAVAMEMKQLHLAIRQVLSAGEDTQFAQATTIMHEARQQLYRLLADQ